MYNETDEYKDIINLSRPKSNKHKPMSIKERAAQFAPFAALTGYGDAIIETGRLTEKKTEIDEEQKDLINRKLKYIYEKIEMKIKIKVTYFTKDSKKEGGKYITTKGEIMKIDDYNKKIVIKNDVIIPIKDIINIEIIKENL